MCKKIYTVIIGDMVKSKDIINRKEVQEKFKKVLEDINIRKSESIVAEFQITLGDEFQGLLSKSGEVLDIISYIQREMFPIKFRFGIGVGEVNTDINISDSREIDGKAYHRGRKMINILKEREVKYSEPVSNIMICSEEENSDMDKLMNSLFSLTISIKTKWTDRQREIIYTYLDNEENQYKAGRALNIGQPVISKALRNASFYEYKEAWDTVKNVLKKRDSKHND